MKHRLAIILPELLPMPPVKGGAIEYWVEEFYKNIDKSRYHVSIVSRPADIGNVNNEISFVGIPWTRTEKKLFSLKERVSRKNPIRYLAKIQNVFSYSRRLADLVIDQDLLYIHNEPNILFFIKKRSHQKIILHMHNEHLTMPILREFYRKALKKVDVVICVSNFIKKSALKYFPEYSNKFKVVLNATDIEKFKPYEEEAFVAIQNVLTIEKNKKYILYVGRLTEIKGVHVLIRAFSKVMEIEPNARLIIAGSSFFEGATLTKYEKHLKAESAGLKERIIFTGFIPHEVLKYLYSVADISVVPSIWDEPFGLVALEAMASGAALIGTEVGGIPEVIEHERTGLLVPPNDVDALVEATVFLLNNESRRKELISSGLESVRSSFNWGVLVENIDNQFKGLV